MSKQSETESKQPKRNAKADAFFNIAHAMLRRKTGLPDFPENFGVLEDETGVRHFIEISDDGVCKPVHPAAIDSAVTRYYMRIRHAVKVNLTPRDLPQVRTAFANLADTLHEDQIKPVLQKHTKGLTWNRLPFDCEDMPTPTFDEFISRCTNHDGRSAQRNRKRQQRDLPGYGAR